MTTHLNNIDLKGNQLLNARIQNLAQAPAKAELGQIYFDTTENALMVFTEEGWKVLGAVEGLDDNLAEVLENAKAYANQIKTDLLGSAGEDYDTFKEIEDFLKGHSDQLKEFEAIPEKFVMTIGDGIALAHSVPHYLGSRDVVVTLRTTKAPFEVVLADVELIDENTLTVRTAQPLAEDELTVVVIG